MSLHDLVCKHAKSNENTYRLIDEGGLYLEIRPTGAKNWKMRYRFHGKENTLSIGSYPHVSLTGARVERDKAKTLLKDGIDPNLDKKEAAHLAKYQHGRTFEICVRDWHTQYYDTWKPKTAEVILRRFELYMFPHVGKYPETKISPQMLLTCFQRIEKLSPDVAERLLKHTIKAFRYSKITGRMTNNPADGLKDALKKYTKGNYASIAIEELPAFLQAIESNKQRLYRQTILAMRLLMLTAVRTTELIEAKWKEIDFDKAMWTVPSERMKMKLEHLVPLSKQAIEILLELKEQNGHREYIFPRKNHFSKPMSNATILRVLIRMGYKGRMTGHGFRTLFMGISKEKLKYAHDIPDRQLAHVPNGTNGKAYDRAKFLDDRTRLMQDYADYIDNQLNKSNERKYDVRQSYTFTQPYSFTIPTVQIKHGDGFGAAEIQQGYIRQKN